MSIEGPKTIDDIIVPSNKKDEEYYAKTFQEKLSLLTIDQMSYVKQLKDIHVIGILIDSIQEKQIADTIRKRLHFLLLGMDTMKEAALKGVSDEERLKFASEMNDLAIKSAQNKVENEK